MKGKKTTRQMLEGEGAFKAVETITNEVEEGSLTEHKDEFIAFLKDIAKDSKVCGKVHFELACCANSAPPVFRLDKARSPCF